MTAPLRVGISGCGNAALNYHLPAYLPLPDRFQVHVPEWSSVRSRGVFGFGQERMTDGG